MMVVTVITTTLVSLGPIPSILVIHLISAVHAVCTSATARHLLPKADFCVAFGVVRYSHS